jgi:hypothetical protein
MPSYEEMEDFEDEDYSGFDDDEEEDDVSHLLDQNGRYLSLAHQMEDLEWTLDDIGWEVGDPSPHLFKDIEDFQEAARRQRAKVDMKEAFSEAIGQPQESPQQAIATFLKTLSDSDKVLFDKDQAVKAEIQGWRNEMQAAEDIGDQQRYQRAEYWLREGLAEQEELYREHPELEAQKQFRNEQAIRSHEGLLRFLNMPLEERRHNMKEAQELVEWNDQQDEAQFSISVDNEARMFRIDHPGLTAREATRELSRNQLTEEYPAHSRKLDSVRSKIGVAKNWTIKQITPEPGAKSKPKPKVEKQPQGDLEIVSARPGEDNVIEHLDMEEAQQEFEQQKADQNRGPQPRTHLFSRMW